MSELLQEFVDSRQQRLRVDREAGVIRGVKLLGLASRNGRRYREEALVNAVSLYEGAKVNINHPKGHPLSPRDYQDRLGVVRGVEFRAGEGLFGDLHFNPKHALSEQLVWDAEHAPQNVGMSHNVLARTTRSGNETVVEAIAELRRRAAEQMRANISAIPDGIYRSQAFVDSDGVVNEPLTIALAVEKHGDTLSFDFSDSSKPCAGPMNSVLATTLSSVYLAMRHIFPDVPISAGAFEPLIVKRPEGTFLDAKYPRPVSGCAAEVSQRIAEAVFAAMVQALPDKVTAAPAGSSGNFALGGNDPARGRDYVMYQISGGGYGGNAGHDGLSNGCSTIGISKSPPVEIMEQAFPVLYRHYALREGSGGAGRHRGGFGLAYEVEILRGDARASFVMDHGRFGPQGALGGKDGAVNTVTVFRDGKQHVPPHLSKEQDIALQAGDRVRVGTPGGGGYGDPLQRDPQLVLRDVALGYYTPEQASEKFGVALSADGSAIDQAATERARAAG